MHVGLGEIRERVGILEGRTRGSNGEQRGVVYRQPGTEVDDSCHIWREPSKWKGTQRGDKGELAGGARGARGVAPCKRDVCGKVIEPLE